MHPKYQFYQDVQDIRALAATTDFDCRGVLLPETEPDYQMKMTEEFRRDYIGIRFAVSQIFHPSRICEIGVCSGVGALSMLAGSPKADYFGIDNLREDQHRETNLVGRAKELMDEFGFNARIIIADSQTLSELPGAPFDLVHVDGMHTHAGAKHDVELAWRAIPWGGHILVDDCYNRHVAAGVFDALESLSKGDIMWRDLFGSILIRKWKSEVCE